MKQLQGLLTLIEISAAGSFAVVAATQEPGESGLFGMHGSLTSAEQLVPLLRLPAL